MTTWKLHVWILNAWKVINGQAQKLVNLKIKGFVLKKSLSSSTLQWVYFYFLLQQSSVDRMQDSLSGRNVLFFQKMLKRGAILSAKIYLRLQTDIHIN